jgi:hypothetical protein
LVPSGGRRAGTEASPEGLAPERNTTRSMSSVKKGDEKKGTRRCHKKRVFFYLHIYIFTVATACFLAFLGELVLVESPLVFFKIHVVVEDHILNGLFFKTTFFLILAFLFV